ncbi:cilia- and flagella-associated protein 73 [Selaginella moellendorffii]|uniref:cilia- and flagella-associated protein 73 n=1 Tax=Selaginella moellendorffii TaxID=88036 RepID=UPI000D1C9D16|nr:cilia- and flagella-associated protein 73 [Selaginella moellendorffii]|eukprot:XP_024516016.1 cilia- and flagella-associated protein 73 [Selaginella moellendorffii]
MATGGGQVTVVALDKALPATRLLEKRRLMFQVQEALERKKVEFASKEDELTRREEALRIKDRELQDSLIGFSKFLQENNIKRIRAEKKAADEIRLQAEKEAEIRQIETKIEQLQNEKVATKNALGRMMAYQKYLETVVEVAEEYHEVNDLLLRYSTLLSTNEDLRTHVEQCTDTIEALRAELQTYYKSAISEILNLENDVTLAKQAYERKKHETAEMEKKMDSILQISAAKTLVRGQACMAAENLFGRVCHNSRINHVPQSSPLRQLDVVGDYVSDTNAIIKAVKAGALKKDELGHFSPGKFCELS